MEIKKTLVPGFRYDRCCNKDCNKKYITAMTYKNKADRVCSARCHFIVKEQLSKTLWRFK